MKNKIKFNDLFYNDKFVLVFSFLIAVGVWLAVVINVGEETSRVIKDVKVHIDTAIPSQFGLEVFGNTDYTVDVTVSGKKYQISNAALSADDILVTAQTNNVDSAGIRTLQLKAEDLRGRTSYKISATSLKTIDVYFDTSKTVQLVIEPELIADGFEVVDDGYTCGELNLSESSVSVTGPSAEINRINKVTASLKLDAPLSANKSAKASVHLSDENGKSDFKYISLSLDEVVLTIPVFKVKEVETSVTFKNAPDNYVVNPLSFNVSPEKDLFNISVDDYEKTNVYSIGTVDFKNLSPTNHVFSFNAEDLGTAKGGETETYTVNVDVTGIEQEYFTIDAEKYKITEGQVKYNVSELNKSVVIVGAPKNLSSITEDMITVAVDLSDLDLTGGQTVTVPAVVTVKSDTGCWVYGTYSVDVSY